VLHQASARGEGATRGTPRKDSGRDIRKEELAVLPSGSRCRQKHPKEEKSTYILLEQIARQGEAIEKDVAKICPKKKSRV